MGKKTKTETEEETREAFDELLDALPATEEDTRKAFDALIEAFPSRAMSNPERRGGLTLSWMREWPFYEVTFNGWNGAAGRREIALVRALRGMNDEAVEASFVKAEEGYARMLISIHYGIMAEAGPVGVERFRTALNLVRPYRVDSGYTWTTYEDVEEGLRG